MSLSNFFEVVTRCRHTAARLGRLSTPHGNVATPAFMPVGTQAAVKALTPQEVRECSAEIILANTYHLYLRPGVQVVRALGGLHAFMAWQGPILTDSGGFQVYSLAPWRRIRDEGVLFRSHIDGSEHLLTPERAMEWQEALGADIIMALDECPPHDASEAYHREALGRTHRWAQRCLAAHLCSSQGGAAPRQALFAIVQGGLFPHLRRDSSAFLSSLDFPGYGIGGLSLGEPKSATYTITEETVAALPEERPRYLMGVGTPEDLVEAVARGVDLFDSAMPTRVARNGALYTPAGRINIRGACFRCEPAPVSEGCACYTCRHFSAAYLHHLFKARELLAYRLATIHNLHFILSFMRTMREAIAAGSFPKLREEFLAHYRSSDPSVRAAQRAKWLAAHARTAP